MKLDWGHELGRKAVHLSSVLIIVIYILIGRYSHQLALLTLTLILVVFLELDFFRIEQGQRVGIFRYLQKFKRDKEKNHIGGDSFFMIGAILSLAIFDFRVAVAAILMTTFGDMTAALVGKRFGTHKIGHSPKTWEGTLSGFAINVLIGWLFVRSTLDNSLWYLYGHGPLGSPIWSVILVMAVTASVAELLINKLDDNLIVPLFSGFNGQLILLFMSAQAVFFV